MFERAVVINPGLYNGNYDVGRLLDAMLYYSKIDFIVDARSFTGLWKVLGKDGTKSLLSHPSLNVQITPEMPVILNNTVNGITTHSQQTITASGKDNAIIKHSDTARSIHQLISNNYSCSLVEIRKMLNGFKETRYSKIIPSSDFKTDLFSSLISDSESMRLFLRAFAAREGMTINDDLIKNLHVDTISTKDGFIISNNIDLDKILIGARKIDRWDEVLPFALDYKNDLHISQALSSDIISNNINVEIASARIDVSINRALKSKNRISAFEEFAFESAGCFGEAFNEGKMTLRECLKIIDSTDKFRSWLTGIPVNRDIVKEYHLAVNRETILGKMPARVARFSIFTGAGIAADLMGTGGLGTLAGVGISAFDNFVVDGLIKGWRPSNFVAQVKSAIESNK